MYTCCQYVFKYIIKWECKNVTPSENESVKTTNLFNSLPINVPTVLLLEQQHEFTLKRPSYLDVPLHGSAQSSLTQQSLANLVL